jgi:hypothetical protein
MDDAPSMLSEAKSRLSGNVDGGIATIEQASSGNDADLPAGRQVLLVGT